MSDVSFIEVEEVDRDPVAQFLNMMEFRLGDLGSKVREGRSNRLIETAKSGKFNFELIVATLDRLQKASKTVEAVEISRKAKKHLQASAENILYLRSQVEKISGCLVEAAESLEDGDLETLQCSLEDITKFTQRISSRSQSVKDELTENEEALLAQYMQFKKEAEGHDKNAQRCTTGKRGCAALAVTSAVAAVPAALAAGGSGAVVISSPGLGTAAVVVCSVCPVTLCAGIIGAATCGLAAYVFAQSAKESQLKAEVAKDMTDMTHSMREAVDINNDLWTGVGMAATNFSENLGDLCELNPKRKKQFQQTTQQVAKSLKVFVEALDEYMIWLSRCEYFPATYSLQSHLGDARYKRISALMDSKA